MLFQVVTGNMLSGHWLLFCLVIGSLVTGMLSSHRHGVWLQPGVLSGYWCALVTGIWLPSGYCCLLLLVLIMSGYWYLSGYKPAVCYCRYWCCLVTGIWSPSGYWLAVRQYCRCWCSLVTGICLVTVWLLVCCLLLLVLMLSGYWYLSGYWPVVCYYRTDAVWLLVSAWSQSGYWPAVCYCRYWCCLVTGICLVTGLLSVTTVLMLSGYWYVRSPSGYRPAVCCCWYCCCLVTGICLVTIWLLACYSLLPVLMLSGYCHWLPACCGVVTVKRRSCPYWLGSGWIKTSETARSWS